MDKLLQAFEKIAPFLQDPLVLIGFVLLLVFGIQRRLFRAKPGIVPKLSQEMGGKVVLTVLRYGFLIALVVILLGVALRFYEIQRKTPPPVDVAAIMERLEAGHRQELARLEGRHREDLENWKQQAEQAVTALADLRGQPDAPPGIDQALAMLAEGRTSAAEEIFEEIVARRQADIREAAAAYRYLGALAFLHDTQKALNAYRRATELDPTDAMGWNQLGQLLARIGALDEATAAFRKIQSLGEAENDRALLVIAYGNLGNVYRIRGELTQVEAMHQKALAIDEELGRKEGMAIAYDNLGLIYQTRGELAEAEAMYKKSLAINEELGHKQYMAVVYGNLGNVYRIRGELAQAEAMFKKSLAIDEELERKEGMANQYVNLGLVYQTRGELDEAEAMYNKALAINKELGHKEGMATSYGNLGVLYEDRGDPARTEAMYEQALGLFQAVGARPQVEKTRRLLEKLRQAN